MLEPFGFHLSDGVLHTYLRGNEYESTAWDWNFIPGITVDYGATPLNCDGAATSGVEAFVGGVSTGQCGVAAMRYTNPTRQTALHWQKAWFFLQHDVQHVMVSGVASSSGTPVYTVLDQRLHNGSIMVDGSAQRQSMNSTIALSLWHGDVGYSFPKPASLSAQFGIKTGNWSSIGTSTQPASTVVLFVAWIQPLSNIPPSLELLTLHSTANRASARTDNSK